MSKPGETELCGLRNVADVLSTIDWAGVRRVWDEIQSIPSSSGAAVVRKDSSADRHFYCLKALFHKCTSSYCKHLHGCPFCPSRLDACRCMSAHFVKQVWDLLPSQANGRAVVVAPVARKANVPSSSLRVAPDLDQNHALIVLDLRIALDGVRRQLPCQRPRSCHRRSHLPVSFTMVLKNWGVTAWPSKLRALIFQDMAFASELTRHGFRRAQTQCKHLALVL